MPPSPLWFQALAIVGAATLLSTLILLAVFLTGTWLDRVRYRRAARAAKLLETLDRMDERARCKSCSCLVACAPSIIDCPCACHDVA